MTKEIQFTRNAEAERISSILGNICINKTAETVTYITFNGDDTLITDIVEDGGGKILYCRPTKMS